MRFAMTSTLRLTCLLLTSTAFACAEGSELDDMPEAALRDGSGGGGAGAGGGGLDPYDEVCDPSNQVVVFSTSNGCDDFVGGDWEGARLFNSSAAPPEGLARYCRYTFDGAATPDDVKDLTAELENTFPAGFEIGTDCRVVEPQNSAISDEIGVELDEQFGALSGRVTSQQVKAALPLFAPSEIHTAIVDTYPSFPAAPAAPNSTHGPVVASIIESFLCSSGPNCNHKVRNYLGLPRTNDGLNTTLGGQVGRQSDLARGIYAAIVADSALSAEHLVINLSVAWEAERFGGTGLADMSPAARSVYDAIRVARCRGALIIAAAGNESGLSCTGEPMAPARWEGIPAPISSECAELGLGLNSRFEDDADYAPLVHAVGGLFGANTAMATSRDAGMPRLAAASSHAVAHPHTGLPGVVVRTGTSIGTAVASATASLVWSYRPLLTPSEVMDVLYQSSLPVGGLTADFGSAGSTDVHRIDACAAVEHAVPIIALNCSTSTPYTVDYLATEVEAAVTDTHTLSTDPGVPCVDGCGGGYTFHPVPGSLLGCDDVEPDPWRWLTAPQPVISGCQECILTTESSADEASALLTVADHFDSDDIKEVELEIHDTNGVVHIFGITDKELQTGAIVHPRTGYVDEFVVPMSLTGLTPEHAYIVMSFIDPNNAESIETRDAMILRTNP